MKVGLMQDGKAIEQLSKKWKIVPFKKVLKDSSGGNLKIKTKDTLKEGSLSVVDQGKDKVIGYTNNIQAKVKAKLPLIVFGDHTRNIKYVDFDFAMGADGTKVLEIINSDVYPKFIYYYMISIDIINTGYNRHFKYVKDLVFPLPTIETQKRIAEILDSTVALRDKTKQLLDEYDQLAKSIFLEMFGDPVTKQKAFKRVALDSIVKISSGSTPSRKTESYWNGDIPWVKTGEVNSKLILDTEEKISEEGLRNSSCKIYTKGSIIIAMYGQGKTRGQVGMLGVNSATNQACAVLQPSDKINFSYLYEYLKLSYNDLRSLGRGGNQPNLNAGLIKNYQIFLPPIDLQNQFAGKIALIEQQKDLAKQELQESENLFHALLQKAFKGELVKEEKFETA